MAKSTYLTSCINTFKGQLRRQLPEAIQQAAENDDKALMIAGLNQHLDQLRDLRKELRQRYNDTAAQFMEQANPTLYTQRSHDPSNELNSFQVDRDKYLKNLVQRAGGILKAAQLRIFHKRTSEAERETVKDFLGEFGRRANTTIERLFLAKEGSSFPFRFEDMLQYFPNRQASEFAKGNLKLDPFIYTNSKGEQVTSLLDPALKAAIAATAYEWLGTDGPRRADGQTEETLRSLLELEKDEDLPDAAEHLKDVGVYAESLAEALGRTILDRLALTVGPDAAASAKGRMEMSLGQMAIAVMEDQGFVRRDEIFVGEVDGVDAPFGREAIKQNFPLDYEDIFYLPAIDPVTGKDTNSRKGKPTMKLITLADTKRDQIEAIKKLMDKTPDVFNKLFASDGGIKGFTWDKPAAKKSMKIGRTGETANALQAANVQKYNEIAYVPSAPTMQLFAAMIDLDPEAKGALGQILGKETMDGKLALRNKRVKGIERSVDRDLQNVKDYIELRNERVKAGKSAKIYAPSVFMSNMRMLMRGYINPQNSKMHRNLFSQEDWNVSFVPNKELSIADKDGTEAAFFEALAQAFDIESGKVGGFQNQLQTLDDLLNHPDRLDEKGRLKHEAIRAALEVLQEQQIPMTLEKMDVIAAGVKAIGTKTHGLKGLVEYARYLNHENGKFTTDLYNENDGVSNGVIMLVLQMIPDHADKQAVLALLAMGGVNVGRKDVNLDELRGRNNLTDAYMRMGQLLTKEVLQLEKDLLGRGDDGKDELSQLRAIKGILGPFHKNGIVDKIVRTLSKPRTMQTVYGAGIAKQSDILAGSDVINDGIYVKVEKTINDLTNNPDKKSYQEIENEFRELLEHVNVLTAVAKGKRNKRDKVENYFKDGQLDVEKLTGYFLNKDEIAQIKQAVRNTYGEAMNNAITTIYKPFMDARAPLNDTVQRAVTVYNAVLKAKTDALVQARLDRRLAELKVSKDSLDQEHYAKVAQVTQAELDQAYEDHDNDDVDPAKRKTASRMIKDFNEAARISKTELDAIVQELEPLLPKIKTPLHQDGKDGESYLPLVTVGKTKQYSSKDMVRQIYAPGTLPRLKGYASSIPFLDPAGMAPMVKTIQMLDSMGANHLMSTGIPILNNHDGFSHSIQDGEAVRDAINSRFGEIMETYYLGKAFAEMNAATTAAGLKALKASGVSYDLLLESLIADQVITLDLLAEILDYDVTWLLQDVNEMQVREEMKRKEATERVIRESVLGFTETKGDSQQFVTQLFKAMERRANTMAKETASNQKHVTNAVTEWAQYPYRGKGVKRTPKNTGARIFKDKPKGNVLRDKVTSVDGERTEEVHNTIRELVQAIAFQDAQGSSDGDISTNPGDYTQGSSVVDSLNVRQVFETIVDQDRQAAHSSIQDHPDQVAHLSRVLEKIVAKVMTPIELFKDQHQVNEQTQGLFTVDTEGGRKIWIRTQPLSAQPQPGLLGQGIRMSAAEVYAHELIHHITYGGLKKSNFLWKQSYDLYELAEKQLTDKYGANAFRVFMNDPNADLTDPANGYEILAAKERWAYVFNPERQKDGKRAGLQEFIAFGMTNANFRRELAHLTIDDKTFQMRTSLKGLVVRNAAGQVDIQASLVSLFDRIMDFIHQSFYSLEHSKRMDQELENLTKALSEVDRRSKGAIYRNLVALENKLTALSVSADEKIVSAITNQSAKKKADDKLERLEKIKKDMQSLGLAPGQYPAAVQKEIQELDQEIQTLLAQDEKSVRSKISNLILAAKRLPEYDTMLSYRMRQTLQWYRDKEQGLIPTLISEMQGNTERLKPLHRLLNRSNRVLDAAKEDAAATMLDVVNSWFTKTLPDGTKVRRELTSSQKTALTKAGLKTDLSSLLDLSSQAALIGYVSDEKQREARIDFLLQEISKDPLLAPHRHFFEKAADDLAYYMITSEARPDGVPMMNAHNIALMHGLPTADVLKGDALRKAISRIDQLATLMSLRYVRGDHKRDLAALMRDDWDGINGMLIHHNVLKERSLIDAFGGKPALMQKGYTKQILDARIQYEQGTLADAERYLAMGYTMEKSPIQRDPDDPVQEDIYLFKSNLGTVNDYQSGAISYNRNSAKGTTQYEIQMQIGNTVNPGQEAQSNNQHMQQVLQAKLAKMYQSTPRAPYTRSGKKNYMIPKFDVNGNITELRYMMSEYTKDTVLQQFSEFDAVLASMSSQIIEKKFTPVINAEVVDALKDMYDAEFAKYPDAYVEISPHSDHQRYRDIYHMLPDKTKQQIYTVWGGHRMWVSQDVVDLVFGQRKYTITELFTKDRKSRKLLEVILREGLTFALGFNNPFINSLLNDEKGDSLQTRQNKQQGRAINRAKRIEETMMQMTKMVKGNIVVRNLGVTSGNHLSNMAYLKSKGIPLDQILTLSREAFKGALAYQKDKQELDRLLAQRDVIERDTQLAQTQKDVRLKNIDRLVARLETQMANNPSTALIAAGGLMPQIVDDVNTARTQSPHLYGLDAAIETGLKKLPAPLEKATRTLFMTQETESYRIANNAVKMTDYIGRYVLYHHYTAKGMPHKDAISAVEDEFINFNLPTHRMVEYGNNIGLLWFSKYQLRVLKHIKNLIAEHPFTTLATLILGSFMGNNNNIMYSIPWITKDVGQIFGDPFSAVLSSPWDTLYLDLVDKAGSAVIE